jgi:Tfp pilus assembly pilus retraction ATPase PilT
VLDIAGQGTGADQGQYLLQGARNAQNTVNLIENVFNAEEKAAMIRKLTDTLIAIEGEAMLWSPNKTP